MAPAKHRREECPAEVSQHCRHPGGTVWVASMDWSHSMRSLPRAGRRPGRATRERGGWRCAGTWPAFAIPIGRGGIRRLVWWIFCVLRQAGCHRSSVVGWTPVFAYSRLFCLRLNVREAHYLIASGLGGYVNDCHRMPRLPQEVCGRMGQFGRTRPVWSLSIGFPLSLVVLSSCVNLCAFGGRLAGELVRWELLGMFSSGAELCVRVSASPVGRCYAMGLSALGASFQRRSRGHGRPPCCSSVLFPPPPLGTIVGSVCSNQCDIIR